MLFRFQIELSDVNRGIYESLDFRIAQHPSEAAPYLLTRTLAYCLSYQSDLEFTAKGLGDPDGPALQVKGPNGAIELWIEIGNPSARKMHRASKAAKQVAVYTYKKLEILLAEISSGDIHRAQDLKIYSFEPKFLGEIEACLEKNNRWSILVQDNRLNIEIGQKSISTEMKI